MSTDAYQKTYANFNIYFKYFVRWPKNCFEFTKLPTIDRRQIERHKFINSRKFQYCTYIFVVIQNKILKCLHGICCNHTLIDTVRICLNKNKKKTLGGVLWKFKRLLWPGRNHHRSALVGGALFGRTDVRRCFCIRWWTVSRVDARDTCPARKHYTAPL